MAAIVQQANGGKKDREKTKIPTTKTEVGSAKRNILRYFLHYYDHYYYNPILT
jgi:hypothetical protein